MEAFETAMSGAHHADLMPLDCDPASKAEAFPPRKVERREMLEDVEAYGDWRTRPVGETVAKLCEALGLAPDSCVERGQTWWVRRCPTAFESRREEARLALHPSPPRGGTDREAIRVGRGRQTPRFPCRGRPHSGCFASCLSP